MSLKKVIMLYIRLMVSGNLKVLRLLEIKGVHRDYLTIQYQDAATISLPVEQIESLWYVSADGKEPKINKLNDGRFQKTKQKVSKPSRGYCWWPPKTLCWA